MTAFFAWGNVPNSFVVAKGSLLDYENLPPDYVGKFKVNDWNAMQLSAFYTGPNGYHWAITPNNNWSARGPQEMLPYLQTQSTVVGPDGLCHLGRGRATFVAFAPGGAGWFIRYNTNQTLCVFDTNRWFVEWKRGTTAEFRYSMGDGERSRQDMERVTKVLSGVGNDAALVASHQNAQLVAANGAFAQAVALSRVL
ncbi:hypothetical protein F4824DRAFT_341072 [Ustulina deusta]|nr:hypothetical protein F4824DRAFT_341072 [Ustulina deusta]